jgi:hypothetical protein
LPEIPTALRYPKLRYHLLVVAKKKRRCYDADVDEGRKRVILIAASILVARHLKNPEDLNDYRPSPRTEALIANAVRLAERILQKIDNNLGTQRA